MVLLVNAEIVGGGETKQERMICAREGGTRPTFS